MIEKKTVLSQAECTDVGVMQIRLDKLLVEDGKVIAHDFHRMSLAPGDDLGELIKVVNNDLSQMGYPAVPVDVVSRIQRLVDVDHTPTITARFKAEVARREAEIEARREKTK